MQRLLTAATLATAATLTPHALAQHRGVQINVNANDNDTTGDAANEVSAVMWHRNFNLMAAGWRQFADTETSLPAAGFAFSTNGGIDWTFPGTITHFPNNYNPAWVSDPVLHADEDGLLHFSHLIWTGGCSGSPQALYMSHSGNFGQTWVEPRTVIDVTDRSFVLDKPWVTSDRSHGTGHNNVYVGYVVFGDCATSGPLQIWSQRSTTRGDTWGDPVIAVNHPAELPMTAVDLDGNLYCIYLKSSDHTIRIVKSDNARYNGRGYTWDALGGSCSGIIGQGTRQGGINIAVGAHQPYLAIDMTDRVTSGNLYVAWAGRYQGSDTEILFSRSTDGGCSWSAPTYLNTEYNWSYQRNQYLPAISVAPNGRIDVAWYDFRNSTDNKVAEIVYRFSEDGGLTWSAEKFLTPPFDVHLGKPGRSSKIGEYISIQSSIDTTRIVYVGTYEGEQNLYCRRYTHNFPVKALP